MNILLIDDNQIYRDSMKAFLEFCGYFCTATDSPKEAIRLFKGNPFHYQAVITDYWMPGQDGGEVIRQLKTIQPRLPIVVTSARQYTGITPDYSPEAVYTILEDPMEGRQLQHILQQIEAGLSFSGEKR